MVSSGIILPTQYHQYCRPLSRFPVYLYIDSGEFVSIIWLYACVGRVLCRVVKICLWGREFLSSSFIGEPLCSFSECKQSILPYLWHLSSLSLHSWTTVILMPIAIWFSIKKLFYKPAQINFCNVCTFILQWQLASLGILPIPCLKWGLPLKAEPSVYFHMGSTHKLVSPYFGYAQNQALYFGHASKAHILWHI